MSEILSIENIGTLMMLILLQVVLGFDNLLYISIESKRVSEDRQQFVRRLGIGLAIFLRIFLLFVVVAAIDSFKSPFVSLKLIGVLSFDLNVHGLIVLLGGVFIIYTAVKEIFHMLSLEAAHSEHNSATRSVASAVSWIVLMNLVFSFDSILSAIALTEVFWVMALAIVVSGVLMIVLADGVSSFLKRNRAYEILGLFILFIVGIMLLSEGGHLAHLKLLGYPVEAMSKSTFYFSLIVWILVDLAQSRYQRKILAQTQ